MPAEGRASLGGQRLVLVMKPNHITSQNQTVINAEELRRYIRGGFTLIPHHTHDATIEKRGKVRKLGKAPLHKNWSSRTDYNTAHVLDEAIKTNRNVGIQLKADQLVIVVDPSNGGTEGFAALRKALGIDPSDYPTCVTGSGELHLYMSKQPGLIVDTLPDFPGVEFKSEGRRVVAAGSIHPDTLKHYEWDDRTPDVQAGLPSAPQMLLNVIARPTRDLVFRGGGQMTQTQVAIALARLDPEDFRDEHEFLRLMKACRHASLGDARSEFIEWATDDPHRADDAETIGRLWDTLDTECQDGGELITFRALLKMVREKGDGERFVDKGERTSDSGALATEGDGANLDDPDAFEGKVNGITYQVAVDIEAEPIEWLWCNRYPVGKLSMIAGFPDQGKSLVTMNIAAIVSRGADWPNGEGQAEQGAVVILSAEDDAADTVVPRLTAAGADLDQCLIVNSMVRTEGGARVLNLQDDLGKLSEIVRKERGNGRTVRLVIIDPISSYMGGKAKGDTFKNSEVRAMLTPLAEWAARLSVAVIAVSHFNKSGNGRAIYRVTDSLAFTAAARSVWLTAEDKDDPKRRLLLKGKLNIANDPGGLAYKIEGVKITPDITAPRIVWDGRTDITAEEALGQEGGKQTAADRAMDFLFKLLSDGPIAVSAIKERAEAAGYSWRTIRRARAGLPVKSGKDGFNAGWQWSLGRSSATSSALLMELSPDWALRAAIVLGR